MVLRRLHTRDIMSTQIPEEEIANIRKRATYKPVHAVDEADLRLESLFLSCKKVKGKESMWYLNYHDYVPDHGVNVIAPFMFRCGLESDVEYVEPHRVAHNEELGNVISARAGWPIVLSDGPKSYQRDGIMSMGPRSVFVGITSSTNREFWLGFDRRIQDLFVDHDVLEMGTNRAMRMLAQESMTPDEEAVCYMAVQPKPDSPDPKARPDEVARYEARMRLWEDSQKSALLRVEQRVIDIFTARQLIDKVRKELTTPPTGKKTNMLRQLVATRVKDDDEIPAAEGKPPNEITSIGISLSLGEAGTKGSLTEVYFMVDEVDESGKTVMDGEYPSRRPLPATCDDLKKVSRISFVAKTGKLWSVGGQMGLTLYAQQIGIIIGNPNAPNGASSGASASESSGMSQIMVGTKKALDKGPVSSGDTELALKIRRALEDREREKEHDISGSGSGSGGSNEFGTAEYDEFERSMGFSGFQADAASRKRPAAADLSSFVKKTRV